MTVNEKLGALRVSMKNRGIDGYVIPSADPHLSEYFSSHWAARAYFSGFTGSAGTLVVTENETALWTDGRYYLQASMQLEGSEIRLMRASEPDCPKVFEYLRDNLPSGGVAALDGMLFSENALTGARKTLAQNDISLRLDGSVIYENWPDRPEEVFTEAFELDESYTGCARSRKLAALREKLAAEGADSIVVASLDSIAWLLNIRANDVHNTPVVAAFLYLNGERAVLFTDSSRIPQELLGRLAADGVSVMGYHDLAGFLGDIGGSERLLCDPDTLNGRIFDAARSNGKLEIISAADPIIAMKAIKNECELRHQHEAYLKDGCALAEFFAELDERLANGETPTESELGATLAAYRRAQSGCLGDSFDAIIAYAKNAAIVHYSPSETGSARLLPEHMLLVDSGGQYLDGTTDTTRTVALGPLTDEERRDFTLVLKAHIALSTAVFPDGTTGRSLDTLSRINLWKHGMNYRHGTGHGVGYLLGVHEGPHNFTGDLPLREGAVITIEPGYYKDGIHGIRIENVSHVVEAFRTEYGRFLRLENFTVFPMDTTCVDFSLLTQEERGWLKSYNNDVIAKLSPLVSDRAKKWLARYRL